VRTNTDVPSFCDAHPLNPIAVARISCAEAKDVSSGSTMIAIRNVKQIVASSKYGVVCTAHTQVVGLWKKGLHTTGSDPFIAL